MGVQTGPPLPGALHRKTDRWTDRSTTTRSITHKQMGGQTDPQQQGTLHRHTDGWTDGSTTTRSIKNRQTDHGCADGSITTRRITQTNRWVERPIHNNKEHYTDTQMGGQTDPQQQGTINTDKQIMGGQTDPQQQGALEMDKQMVYRRIHNNKEHYTGTQMGGQTDPQQQGALHRYTDRWTDGSTTTRSNKHRQTDGWTDGSITTRSFT